jgi:hypothetical protein
MDIPDRLVKYLAVGMGALFIFTAGYSYWMKRSYDNKVIDLQNEVAKRDVTIEVQKGVFTKLAVQLHDVKGALDTSQESVKKLADEVKKAHADILAVQNVVAIIKEQTVNGQGQQHDVPGSPSRKEVSFARDFGFISVKGWTRTDPPDYQLTLGPGSKPLKLTLTINQLPDKSWRSLVASSDPNVSLEIGAVAVNPYILQEGWWSRVKIAGDVGVGNTVLGGVGILVPVGKFELGPHVWATPQTGAIYGGSFTWAPFKR